MTAGIAPPLPAIEAGQAVEVIVGFIRAQLAQTGFRRTVIGLSGGVDSATVAFLCARAVEADDLLAVRMPYLTSSPASETDALRVVEALGCRSERVEITPMVGPMLELIGRGDSAAERVRRGNVMARQRMIVLYDRSVAFDALVVGTSNKTEALLGYGTLHGDMACALAPIGDLYKSQLRAIAVELGVPPQIVEKA
ncbi:MAG: NAD(+) synthase, partial [Chloroflexota bacterium]|nr:NAD(+) synthase [Chloroflexota bacterium]